MTGLADISPLNEEHLKLINAQLGKLDLAQKQIVLAKQIGLDMSAQQSQLDEARAALLRIKNVYFPGR